MADILGLGLNMIGGLANHVMQSSLMNKQYNQQIDLMHAQNDWNERMWNKNNEYNSPSAQVQRYIDAGLNPALMMQGNSPVAASQMSSASPSVPGAPTPASDFGSLGNMFNDAKRIELEGKQLDIQNKVADANIENLNADTKGKLVDNAWKDILNAQQYRAMESNMREINERIKLIGSEIGSNIANMNLTNAKTMTENAMRIPMVEDMIASWKKKYSDIGVNDANIRNIMTQVLLGQDEHKWNTDYRFKIGKFDITFAKNRARESGWSADLSFTQSRQANLQLKFDSDMFKFRKRAERVERTVGAAKDALGIVMQGVQAVGVYNMGRNMGKTSIPTSTSNPVIEGNTGYQGKPITTTSTTEYGRVLGRDWYGN